MLCGLWPCLAWSTITLPLLLISWRMVSELTEHNGQNSLFIKKTWAAWFLCAHYTMDSDYKITQNIIINCMVMFRTAVFIILVIMFPLNINYASSEESTGAIQALWKVMASWWISVSWRNTISLKFQNTQTQQHSITYQKTWILNKTAVETLYHTKHKFQIKKFTVYWNHLQFWLLISHSGQQISYTALNFWSWNLPCELTLWRLTVMRQ